MDRILSDRIVADLEANFQNHSAPPGATPIPTVPAGRYTNPAFLALEEEAVFGRAWLIVAREEELPEVGSYLQVKRTKAPLLLVRGKDNVVRAFYNTCQHRGAAVVAEDRGKTNLLRCQYHSWAYDLNGKLVAVPDQQLFPCFERGERRLKPVKCESRHGWLFVNLDPEARPLDDSWGEMLDELDDLKMDKQVLTWQHRWEVNCNWKATIDAFCENYHINTIHQETVGKAMDYKATSIGLLPGGHSRMATRYTAHAREAMGRTAGADLPMIPTLTEAHKISNVTYFAYPNTIISLEWAGGLFITFWPLGVDRMEMVMTGIGLVNDNVDPDYFSGSNKTMLQIMGEDMINLECMQRSLRSGAITGMNIAYPERRIYWMHRAIDTAIGRDRIPEGLALPPADPVMETADHFVGPRSPRWAGEVELVAAAE